MTGLIDEKAAVAVLRNKPGKRKSVAVVGDDDDDDKKKSAGQSGSE